MCGYEYNTCHVKLKMSTHDDLMSSCGKSCLETSALLRGSELTLSELGLASGRLADDSST